MANLPLNSTTVVVDDTNPALVYSGVWVSGGSTSEFNATTHGSLRRGSSVRFTFRGTSVSVYGTIGPDTPTSAYIVDDSAPSIFVAGKVKASAYRQMFFESPTLTDADHTLLITNAGSGELWIDYILYTPSTPQPVLPPTSSSLPITPSLQPTLTSSTVTLTPSRTPNIDTATSSPPLTTSETTSSTGLPDQVNSNSKSSIPASAVAGGAIGALVLIIVLIFGMLYYRKRAKRLAGEKLLEKNNIFGDSELDKADPGAPVTPFTSAYTPNPYTSSGYGNSNMNMYPPGSAYPPSDYGHHNQSQPSTPIYHFSNHYSLRSGYSASSDNIAGVGTGPGFGGANHGGTQYGYATSIGQADYLQNPHSQYGGAEPHPDASSDRLVVPERRNSLETTESHTSLAYVSGDRVAMNPSSQLPDPLPGSSHTQATPQHSEKAGFIVHNQELRQHEDGGVRLDVQQPYGSGSRQQQVVDIPPVYKPNY